MIKTLEENKLGRDFVIGDLHGCFELFNKALDVIEFDPAKDRIISVGDLIDRGPDSLSCLKLILEPWFHCVKGNHEQLMEDWVTGGPTGAWWIHNGGQWFFDLSKEDQEMVITHLLPKVQSLPWIITTKKFHVIHAELPAEVTDEDLADPDKFRSLALRQTGDGETCIWGRFTFGQFYAQQVNSDKIARMDRKANHSRIFCGHTIMQKPLSLSGMTNIDTGAFRTGTRNWAGLTVFEPKSEQTWLIQ